jgi:UDP-2,4-diacetamido-2,4,6-trideoxy-beta-L-altropyranose hydrolase
MKILFRCDSSSTIGLGHVMRDLVLAKEFSKDEVHFASLELDGNINSQIPYPLHVLKSNKTEEIIKLILSLHVDMLIIDHYGISYESEKYIKEKTGVKILCFDDTYEKHFCDILLNHNISANASRYKDLVPNHCELRCGSAYTLIRDEFKKEKEKKREKIYDVLLAMGGADSANLNIPILKKLPSSCHVSVLTTSANANLETLKEYVKDKPNISLHVNSQEVAKLINQSRFAITTPSVMVHEILYMDIPFLAIKTASNQDDIYEYLKKKWLQGLQEF